MSPQNTIVILGAGGHAHALLDVLKDAGKFEVAGFVDPACAVGDTRHGIPVIATEAQLSELVSAGHAFAVGVGQMKSSSSRDRIFTRLRALSAQCPPIIARSAHIGIDVQLGGGAQVMHGAIVNAGAIIGEGCILNTRSLVEHDARVGRGTHVSTGAIINGDALVGSRCLVGSNATILQGRRVCDDVIIGAGAVVTRDIPTPGTYIGVPARRCP